MARLLASLHSQRSWHAVVFAVLAAAVVLTIVAGPVCTDACSWACGDCAACAMAAELPSSESRPATDLVTAKTPEAPGLPESIDPRPLESVPLQVGA